MLLLSMMITMTSFLKYLTLVPYGSYLNGSEFGKVANGVGLKGNPNKTQVLNVTSHRFLPIRINGQKFEGINQYI